MRILRAADAATSAELARQPPHVLVRRTTTTRVDGLRRAARDQRGPRRARRGLPAASARQHGDPQLRAGRRARASRQQRRRRRDPRRRIAVDERRPRHRAQRVQRARTPSRCISCRSGSSPIALNARAGLCAARVRSGGDARALGAAGLARRRRRQPRDPPARVAARRAARTRARRIDARAAIRRGATGCRSCAARSRSTAARWRPAMRSASRRAGDAARSPAAATAVPTSCCSTSAVAQAAVGRLGACYAGRQVLSDAPQAAACADGRPYNCARHTASHRHAAMTAATAHPHPGQRREALRRAPRRPAAELPAAVDGAVELASARVPADRGRRRRGQCPYCGAHFVLDRLTCAHAQAVTPDDPRR